MIPNSNAYAILRDKSQEFLDFVVLSCTAVPTLTKQIQVSGVVGIVPDHFKGLPDEVQLLSNAAVYQESLARMIIIVLYSNFEAYVKDLLTEIVDFHGGAIAFQATADKRAKAFIANSSKTIIDSKRKLQEPSKAAKIGSYQKHSAILVKHGFRFPSELLAPYGVKSLIKKAKPKGSKAYEIQELLRDALCYPVDSNCKCTTLSSGKDLSGCPIAKAFPWPVVQSLDSFPDGLFRDLSKVDASRKVLS